MFYPFRPLSPLNPQPLARLGLHYSENSMLNSFFSLFHERGVFQQARKIRGNFPVTSLWLVFVYHALVLSSVPSWGRRGEVVGIPRPIHHTYNWFGKQTLLKWEGNKIVKKVLIS